MLEEKFETSKILLKRHGIINLKSISPNINSLFDNNTSIIDGGFKILIEFYGLFIIIIIYIILCRVMNIKKILISKI